MNIDALSELSRRWSPYSYCYSNLVRYVDPDGMLAKSVIDDLISKSDNDKETKWTFNSEGEASASNGQTANTGENPGENQGSGDDPVFGHKPKEPTSVVGKYFNKIGSKINKQRTILANRLANKHTYNQRLIMAYSFVMEALFETTEAGDLLTNIRESMVDTYGSQEAKEVSEVYSNVLSIVKQIKEDVQGEGGKLVDSYIFQISAAFGAKAVGLQIENKSIALTIKGLDKSVYYYRRIDTSDKGPEGGGFSGGGSAGYYGGK